MSGKQRVQVWFRDKHKDQDQILERVSGERGRLWSGPDYARLVLIGWWGVEVMISQGD